MECNKEENSKNCICTWEDCPRKGLCCQCIKYHWSRNELPACFFSKKAERTYDRSVEKFIEDQKVK